MCALAVVVVQTPGCSKGLPLQNRLTPAIGENVFWQAYSSFHFGTVCRMCVANALPAQYANACFRIFGKTTSVTFKDFEENPSSKTPKTNKSNKALNSK